MGWKDWSSWLKGGIIGLAVYIILVISNITPILNFLASIQSFFLFGNLGEWGLFAFLFSFVIAPILWFLIGALIGWIVGKIKNRN